MVISNPVGYVRVERYQFMPLVDPFLSQRRVNHTMLVSLNHVQIRLADPGNVVPLFFNCPIIAGRNHGHIAAYL
jgi:hypothetical protein